MQRSWDTPWRRPRQTPVFIRHRISLKRWLHLRSPRRLRPGSVRWDVFTRYAGELAAGRREMMRGLRMFVHAKDGFTACGIIVLNPLLMMESSCELLKRSIAKAEARGDREGKLLLERRLAFLEFARAHGVIGMMRKLTRQGKNQESGQVL